MATTYSSFQKNIINEITNGKNNIVVNAVAGSGKTFTMIEAVKHLSNKKILFLAFNNAIKKELEVKLQNYPNCVCSTMHAFGYSILRNYGFSCDYSDARREIETTWLNYSEIYTLDTDESVRKDVFYKVNELYEKARIELCPINDTERITEIANHYNLEYDEDIIKVVFGLMKQAESRSFGGKIDFTDMIYLPNISKYQTKVPKFDIVFIDECQDLNAAQRGILKLILRQNKNCKFVAVGDPKQAINGFAGASIDSFQQLANMADKEMPLSVNYRCGTEIIAKVKHLVPQITAVEGQVSGKVSEFNSFDEITEGDIILSRFTAPLVKTCLYLIKQGKKANIKGNDIAKKFNSYIKRYVKNSKTPLTAILDGFDIEIEKLNKLIENANSQAYKDALLSKIDILKDFADCFTLLIPKAKNKTELTRLINKLFSEDYNNKIINLMTIHKSKGLEADKVLILNNEILPYRNKRMSDWQYEQEKNLQYVAYTRAKKHLILGDYDQINKIING